MKKGNDTKIREGFTKVVGGVGQSVEEIVHFLVAANDAGFNICTEVNGNILYSDTVTLYSAYKEVTGMSYEEFKDSLLESVHKAK